MVSQKSPVVMFLVFKASPLAGPDSGEKRFIHRRSIPPAELKCAGINIPLHGVAKEVGQQEEALLGIESVVNVDLQAIQVASERVGDVSRDDRYAVSVFEMLLHARAVLGKRHFRRLCNPLAI